MGVLKGRGKIRVRLVVGFSLAFLTMAAFGAVSYGYFFSMEQKLVFLSQADEMLNTALEIRRYEKNYFLYHHEEDFAQALAYLREYEAVLLAEREHIERYWGAAAWSRLRELAEEYRRQFGQAHQLLQSGNLESAEQVRAVAGLRDTGKKLIENSEGIARRERDTISSLLRNYRPLLVGFLALLTLIGAWLARGPHHQAGQAVTHDRRGHRTGGPGRPRLHPLGRDPPGRNRLPGPELQQHGRPPPAVQ